MVEWSYSGEADITIGEVHISKVAKIILICLIIALITLTGLGIYFRQYIYDYIADPEIILSDKEVNLEVYSDFDAKSYILNENEGYEYIIENIESLDASKLGDYEILYKSHNSVHSKEATLVVHVVDSTPPEITLTKDFLVLVRGDETKKFKAKEYLKSIEDNYSPKEKLEINFTKNINFDNDEVEVIYTAKDEAGNTATKILNIAVVESEEEKEKKQEETTEEESTTEKESTTEQRTEQHQTTTTYTPPTTQAPVTEAPTTQAPVTEAPTTQAPVTEAQPYINGARDITVSVGTDYSSMINSLISGVEGSGYVSCDYSSVNLTVPGTYPVYWSSDDGVSLTTYVTVVE